MATRCDFPLSVSIAGCRDAPRFRKCRGRGGGREKRRREEGGERGREEGGEGEDSLAVCWRLNRMLSHRGESSA